MLRAADALRGIVTEANGDHLPADETTEGAPAAGEATPTPTPTPTEDSVMANCRKTAIHHCTDSECGLARRNNGERGRAR
jgi:hypothetical protein